MPSRPLTVAVVGATGVVGRTMIQVLIEREFPVGALRALASGRVPRPDRSMVIAGRSHVSVEEARPDAFEGVDIALFSAGGDVLQGALAPQVVEAGAVVIDNSNPAGMHGVGPCPSSWCQEVNADDAATARGHHRQPQLLDDARARAAPCCPA